MSYRIPTIITIIVLQISLVGCAGIQTVPKLIDVDSSSTKVDRSSGSLPPWAISKEEGKKAFDRGLDAVKQKEWRLAIRYFAEARKADPNSPITLLNLGLACAKAGQEISGIAWLEAYLAAEPKAQNADAVRAEIDQLEAAARAKMTKIFEKAQSAAEQLSVPAEKEDALVQIALSLARVGNVEQAIPILRRGRPGRNESEASSWLWGSYGTTLAEMGDPERVEEALKHVTEASDRDQVLKALAIHLMGRGDLAGARKIAYQMRPNEDYRNSVISDIAGVLIAQDDLVAIEEIQPKVSGIYYRSRFHYLLLLKKLEAGDGGGARKLFSNIEDVSYKRHSLVEIALWLVKTGDAQGAKATAREILGLGSEAYDSAVVAAAVLGNYEGAMGKAESLTYWNTWEELTKGFQYGRIAWIQVMRGDLEGAKATLRRAQKTPGDGEAEAGMARALSLKGEFAQALGYAAKAKRIVQSNLYLTIMHDQARAGDLQGAERTFYLSVLRDTGATRASDAQSSMTALLELAKAHRDKKAVSETARLLRLATSVAEYNTVLNENGIAPFLERIIELQNGIGDASGAQATRLLLGPSPRWSGLATSLGEEKYVADLEGALKESATEKPEDLPKKFGWIAGANGNALLRIQGCRSTLR